MTLKRLDNGEIYFGEPKWTPMDTIECLVELEETSEVLPFNATPYDEEDYGKELFEMLSGKYLSQVASCIDSERDEYYANDVRAERNLLIKSTDWTQSSDLPQATRELWAPYRQALRDVPDQPGFPYQITWPVPPT